LLLGGKPGYLAASKKAWVLGTGFRKRSYACRKNCPKESTTTSASCWRMRVYGTIGTSVATSSQYGDPRSGTRYGSDVTCSE
jgi:hypothetical protein